MSAVWISKMWPKDRNNFDLNVLINISCIELVYFSLENVNTVGLSDSAVSYYQNGTFSLWSKKTLYAQV